MDVEYWLIGLICFGAGVAVAIVLKLKNIGGMQKKAEKEVQAVLDDARRRSETVLKEAELEAKDRHLKMKSDFEAESREVRDELKKREKRLLQKEEHIDRKGDQFERRERDLAKKERRVGRRTETLERKDREYNGLIEEQKRQLEKIAGVSAKEAKGMLLKAMENEARFEGAKLIKRIENEATVEADKRPKRLLHWPFSAMPAIMLPSARFRWCSCPAMK